MTKDPQKLFILIVVSDLELTKLSLKISVSTHWNGIGSEMFTNEYGDLFCGQTLNTTTSCESFHSGTTANSSPR